MSDTSDNPCLACGACCMSYRVSFYWAESLERDLPERFTEQLSPFLACMAGTNAGAPRCAALRGPAGDPKGGPFACSVYEHRPSPCREVEIGDEKCRRARMRHGLSPLSIQEAVKTC